ncbi:MAG: hypothetical protein KC491_07295 [Dehalococcoidia bacterium]|nr:hypothetical protein [Dehalococcoidia bacterium]
MSRHLRLLAAAFFAAGVLGGFLLPGNAKATTYYYYVWNQPGTTSTTATLTCGWHNVCTTGTDGIGLDWLNWESNAVYWRSYSHNTQGISNVGRIYVADLSSGSCNTAYAELKSPWGTSLQGIRYLHTDPSIPGSPPYVWSSDTYPATTSFVLGYTVDNDCGQYPDHLHQEVSHANWEKNSYFPTRAGCDDDYGCQDDYVWGEHHSYRTWSGSGY